MYRIKHIFSSYAKKENILALMAYVLPKHTGFHPSVACVTQCPALAFDKACICQFTAAFFTAEALWMPVGVHCLNYASNDKFTCQKWEMSYVYLFHVVRIIYSHFIETHICFINMIILLNYCFLKYSKQRYWSPLI